MSDTPEKVGDFVTIARDGAVAEVTLDRGDPLNRLSGQGLAGPQRRASFVFKRSGKGAQIRERSQ